MPPRKTIQLAPSALTYLIEECRACFYQHVHGNRRPSTPFPSVFSKLDADQKAAWVGRHVHELDPKLPKGAITAGHGVASAPIPIPSTDIEVAFKGLTDSHLDFADGTVGIIDFKTVIPRPQQVDLYSRQLHAYAWAMERPAKPWEAAVTVSHLGLVVFPPEGMRRLDDGSWVYLTHPEWIPIPRDDDKFAAFLQSVGALLSSGPPQPNPDCAFCQWHSAA